MIAVSTPPATVTPTYFHSAFSIVAKIIFWNRNHILSQPWPNLLQSFNGFLLSIFIQGITLFFILISLNIFSHSVLYEL